MNALLTTYNKINSLNIVVQNFNYSGNDGALKEWQFIPSMQYYILLFCIHGNRIRGGRKGLDVKVPGTSMNSSEENPSGGTRITIDLCLISKVPPPQQHWLLQSVIRQSFFKQPVNPVVGPISTPLKRYDKKPDNYRWVPTKKKEPVITN